MWPTEEITNELSFFLLCSKVEEIETTVAKTRLKRDV
jgi:hypothetical protein